MELRERLDNLISVRWIACGGTPTLEQFSDFADLVASLALEEARKIAKRECSHCNECIPEIRDEIAALAESLKGK